MQRLNNFMKMGFVALTALLIASACAESEKPVCGSSDDCAGDQICRDGICVTPGQSQCNTDPDCPSGYVCVANQCSRTMTDDVGLQDTTPPPPPPVDASVPPPEEDAAIDIENPRVTSISPQDTATGIALDTVVSVTFSKPVDHIRTLNALSFYMLDPNERKIEGAISYEAATNTATLTPSTPLLPASRYRVFVTDSVRDLADNPLFQQYEYTFTTAYTTPQLHKDLAEIYAPIVYQGMLNMTGTGPHTDIPTRVDFDGDMDANNNRVNSRSGTANLRANLYYHVTESETHFFFQYVLYYATRTLDNSTTFLEHDMTGIIVVVEKNSLDIVFVEGIKIEQGTADALISFKPSTSSVSGRSDAHRVASFDADGLADGGTRYPLFVPSGNHAACNWYVPGGVLPNRCLHDAASFPQNRGIVMRPGEEGQRFSQRATENTDSGFDEMTYGLLSFVDTFWMNRSDLGCGLYEIAFTYSPDSPAGAGNQRPNGVNGQALVLPHRLCSQDSESYGKTPFRWAQRSGNSGGQWFLDPAYHLSSRFDFGEGYSMDYCYNTFFNIDRRSEPACQD